MRQEAEGVGLDPAVKCICDRCGAIHYRKKVENTKHEEGERT